MLDGLRCSKLYPLALTTGFVGGYCIGPVCSRVEGLDFLKHFYEQGFEATTMARAKRISQHAAPFKASNSQMVQVANT